MLDLFSPSSRIFTGKIIRTVYLLFSFSITFYVSNGLFLDYRFKGV